MSREALLQWASPAKVNWVLRVGERQPDGYHRVQTAMLALGLSDRVTLRPDPEQAPGLWSLRIVGPEASPDIPTDASNLVWRVLLGLPERVRKRWLEAPSGFELEVVKNIPSQAGLGGGSSNAAAALGVVAGWMQSWMGGPSYAPPWTPSEGMAALRGIGSDCAFFGHVLLEGAPPRAWLGGRGDRLVGALEPPVPCSGWSVITPGVACATAATYRALGDAPRARLEMRYEATVPSDWVAMRGNDLQSAALLAEPGLLPWWHAFEACAPGAYQLAGSGASWYAPVPLGQEPASWHAQVLAQLGSAGLTPRFDWVGPGA